MDVRWLACEAIVNEQDVLYLVLVLIMFEKVHRKPAESFQEKCFENETRDMASSRAEVLESLSLLASWPKSGRSLMSEVAEDIRDSCFSSCSVASCRDGERALLGSSSRRPDRRKASSRLSKSEGLGFWGRKTGSSTRDCGRGMSKGFTSVPRRITKGATGIPGAGGSGFIWDSLIERCFINVGVLFKRGQSSKTPAEMGEMRS
ncbi:hypothetical protein CIHG_09689 [Coccidioides immitis H538.4]|uniref:Uncharacterized protein n=1 Tax=Coccidioides immitis H538.4 TaxID=396776 RepID=A0A0J8UVK7_COCIT|nr:hypothetical protein CIHG_09689 [Coccidioides immitis H538.4]